MGKGSEVIRTVMMYLPSRSVSIVHTVTIHPRTVKLKNLFKMDLEILPSLGPQVLSQVWSRKIPPLLEAGFTS